MPKSPTPRNPLPDPYAFSPSPPPPSQVCKSDVGPSNGQPSSSTSSSSKTSSQIWASIESILLAQRTALEAQSAKLAEIAQSMKERIDNIHASQLTPAFGEELAELKDMVKRKKDEGFGFGDGVEWEKVVAVGWMAGPELRPKRRQAQVMKGSERGVNTAMVSGQEEVVPLRFDELIDMNQFEDQHDTGPASSYVRAELLSGIAINRAPIFSGTGSSDSSSRLGNEPRFGQGPIGIDTEASGSAAREILSGSADTVAGTGMLQENANLRSRLLQGHTRPRALSEMSLSSGIESLPETDTRRFRAGSDLTDVLEGISTYLHRPSRARPLSISQSPAPPPPPEGRLRTRTKRPIYSSKWHPMDSTRKQQRLEDEAQQAADEANEELRSVRGLSTAPRSYLAASDGKMRERGRKWPKWGENSLVGRMQDISCDFCRGRAHWACAGYSSHDDMSRDGFLCPDCNATLDVNPDTTPPRVSEAQQERCIRPDCIRRSKRTIVKKKGDSERHLVERVIGRRIKNRRVNGSKRYEYLSKWEGWEVYESTWQDPSSFDDGVNHLEQQFLAQCTREGLNSNARVVMLQEAEEFWDEDGDLRVDLLEAMGIPEAEWWPSPKGRYKVMIG